MQKTLINIWQIKPRKIGCVRIGLACRDVGQDHFQKTHSSVYMTIASSFRLQFAKISLQRHIKNESIIAR